MTVMADAERRRLSDHSTWIAWGPYLAERCWGTVREDYSADGDPWSYIPFEQARSRAYRWSEDGLGGVSDVRQLLCFGFAFWNGADPILKERIFGLGGPEGNHGEDAKELWWYVDNTPSHSWMRWRYVYPQAPFPYERLRELNATRSLLDPEVTLEDTDVLADGYWDIDVIYAKAAPDDIHVRLSARNAGPRRTSLHILPTLWFRNTWSWGLDDRRPSITKGPQGLVARHHELGTWRLDASDPFEALFCENDSNAKRLWGIAGAQYPKDAIGDHVVDGSDTVNPAAEGTKACLWSRVEIDPGQTAAIDLRLCRASAPSGSPTDEVIAQRRAEADEFFASLTPHGTTPAEAQVMRQAIAGLLWNKQYYHFDVARWLDGDPTQPKPPATRMRNRDWRHLSNADIISMPDTWEYPWYAAWDLAFHCVALARVDPAFTKHQLLLLCREWYMHPNGQIPSYEWSFGAVNPPVQAWAARRVFEIDGATDYEFLERMFHKLLLNFTWWVNRKDATGSNVFEGGFLGLDNIGPIDRSQQLPIDGVLEQSDGTSWMAMYCLEMLEIALVLADHDPTYDDMATKFFEHFALIAEALVVAGLWDETDGFSYDVIRRPDGTCLPLRVRSMVGLLPLTAASTLEPSVIDRLPDFAHRVEWFVANRPQYAEHLDRTMVGDHGRERLLTILGEDRLRRVLVRMLDEREFLSPYGLRSLSKWHGDHPFMLDLGGLDAAVGYEPAESRTKLFGGNSNWRGPVWFPLNFLIIEALRRYDHFFGDGLTVEHPVGSGNHLRLGAVADDLAKRLIALFVAGPDGTRPALAGHRVIAADPHFGDLVLFHEYFHGDTGRGLGAAHQTGWTGLVAELIAGRE